MEFLKSRYGSIKGFARFVYYQAGWLGKSTKELQDVNFSDVERLVFVCRGNICRSPFCEYVARSLGVDAQSYGLDCQVPNKAHHMIRHLADRYGIDLNEHRSRDISAYKPRSSDLVVVTEPKQVPLTRSYIGDAQLTLLGLWTFPCRLYIHDPYSARQAYCERCIRLMASGVTELVNNIRVANPESDLSVGSCVDMPSDLP